MSVFVSRLEWIKNQGTGDTQVITNWKNVHIRLSSELQNNQMTIEIPNGFGASSPREYNNATGSIIGVGAFQIDDKFKFYAKYDKDNSGLDLTANSNDLVFFGDLRQLKSKVKDTSMITLTCTDRTFNLLQRIGWATYNATDANAPNGQGWTAPLMVKDIVRQRINTNKQAKSQNEHIYDRYGNLTPSQSSYNSEYLLMDVRLMSEGRYTDANGNQKTTGFVQDDRSVTIDKNGNIVSRTIGIVDSDTTLFPTIPVATRGNNFPFASFTRAGKPIYEMLLYVSQIDMTNTTNELDPDSNFSIIIQRSMRFYVDEQMRFHWFYPTDTIDSDDLARQLNLIMGDTTISEIKEHDMDYVIYELMNYIYYEAGKDMDGDSILGFRYDPTSGAPTIKDSKRVWPKIADAMKNQDRISAGGSITPDASKLGGFAYPTAYPVTPKWNPKITVSSNSQYNTEFKAEARKRGNSKADLIIGGASSQRWKGTVTVQFQNYTILDLIQYTSEAGGIAGEKLRIYDIRHTFNKSGGFTQLNIEKDIRELTI